MRHLLIQGDVFKALATLPDNSIDCCVTSPPYWSLRDYGVEPQVFDGNAECEHDWSEVKTRRPNASGGKDNPFAEKLKIKGVENYSEYVDYHDRTTRSDFCSKCGAWKGTLGLEPTPELYVKHLRNLFHEVKRVLKPTGTLFLNLGDSYLGSWGNYGAREGNQRSKTKEQYGREGALPANLKPPTANTEKNGWIQPKQLALIPSRVAIALQDDGWLLRNDCVWFKRNHMPSSVSDRFANSWEHVFFFTKSNETNYLVNSQTRECVSKRTARDEEGVDYQWIECPKCKGSGKQDALVCPRCKGSGKVKESFWSGYDYWFDLDAVREPHAESSLYRAKQKTVISKETKFDSNDAFTKQGKLIDRSKLNPAGKNPSDVLKDEGYDSKYGDETHQNKFHQRMAFERRVLGVPHDDACANPLGANPADFWDITTRGLKEAHFAVFPPALPERCIKAGCPAEVCRKCGKPRTRITKSNNPSKESFVKDEISGSGAEGSLRTRQSMTSLHRNTSPDGKTNGVYYSGETVGWSDCGCGAGFDSGVVLDVFAGSGTTGMVARSLNRSSVLIELKKDYCEIVKKRLNWNSTVDDNTVFEEKTV